MKLILNYLKPYRSRVTVGVIIKFLGTMMELVLPWNLAYILDHVIPQKDPKKILFWGGVMLAASAFSLWANIVANRMVSRIAKDTTENIRGDLFQKITYLDTTQIEDVGVSSLVSRVTSDTYNIHLTLGVMLRMGIRAPILLVGGILITTTLDPILTLVLVAVMPIIFVMVTHISKKGVPLFGKLQKQVDQLVLTVRENVTGSRVIKALSKEAYERQRFENVNQSLVNAETTANVTLAASPALLDLFLNLGLTLVIVVSAYRVNAGLTQPGVIVAFLTYFTIILNAMLSITRIVVLYSRGLASANRINEVLRKKPTLVPGTLDQRKAASTKLVFDDVTFSYPDGGHAIEHINFSVNPGETLGIMGATGSGKTTIASLILRLYSLDALHQKIGAVLQKDVLFADTIRENILFGRNFSEEQLQQAIDDAQAREFIDKLADGLEHRLEAKGQNLSGGQKQRVLLARALIGQPDLLILDDSSSALDYHTDANLRKALRTHFSDTTKILIAQRISSIQHADKILLLNKGKMIGYGTHEELLTENPTYQEIYQGQTGGQAIEE